jgi:hypothetical protein
MGSPFSHQRINLMPPIAKLFIACLFLLFSTPAFSQETTPGAEGWQVVERCVGELPYPAIPQSEWDFEGVIFSENQDGVRAIRTDVETSYFVALEGDDSFPSVGGFSPDGRWFAYPIGFTDYDVNAALDDLYVVQSIQVVSTDPQQTTYQILWSFFKYGGAFGARALPRIEWIDNTRIIYDGHFGNGGGTAYPFDGEVEDWTDTISLLILAYETKLEHPIELVGNTPR